MSKVTPFFRRHAASAVVIGTLLALAVTSGYWWPAVNAWSESAVSSHRESAADLHGEHDHAEGEHPEDDHAGHGHEEHGHDHGGHDEATSLELSPQAIRNLGLDEAALKPVELTAFDRSITLPATIVDKPGRTHLQVSAPLTGVVTRVAVIEGEAVKPGDLLIEMRVTHEDLVKAQTEFLKSLGELDIERKEIARLEKVTSSGAVAGKVLLEREYERDKLQAIVDAQREALLLHGLSEEQVRQIATTRRLLRHMKVFVPEPGADASDSFRLAREAVLPVSFQPPTSPQGGPSAEARRGDASEEEKALTLDSLLVQSGQAVQTGEPLCVLSDLSELYIEALAFEQDAAALAAATGEGRSVTAVFDRSGGKTETVEGLRIRLLDNQIDPETRTLSAFVELPNRVIRDEKDSGGNRFVDWLYRPGQRLQLRVPVERWEDRLVLPVDAVAREGAENFVFVQNSDHFDRVPVLVEYRDQFDVVIANDGSVFPGDVVARRGAHQMQMALKNKAGGGVDPHAGHNH